MTAPPGITPEARLTTVNLSKVFVLRGAQYPFLILYVMLVPRLMGAHDYGEYALLFSIIAITVSLIDLGMTEIYGRFIPEFQVSRREGMIAKFSSNILALKLALDVVVSAALLLILYLSYGERFPLSYLLFVMMAVFVIDLSTVPDGLLFGLNELGKHALREPLRRALTLMFILLLYHYYGLFGAMLSVVVVEGTIAAIYFFWTRGYFHLESLRIDLRFLLPYLGFGFMFYLSWGLMNLWLRSGNALIDTITKDPRQVGVFDMANQMFSITIAFVMLILQSLIPIYTKLLLSGSEARIMRWSTLAVKYVAILCTGIFAAFVLVGKDLIPLVLGPEFQASYVIGVVLLLGLFPMLFAQLGAVFSVVYKRPAAYLVGLCWTCLAFVAASVAAVPRYGALGCAAASVVSCVVLAGAMLSSFREKLWSCLGGAVKVMALALLLTPILLARGGWMVNVLLLACFAVAFALMLFASRLVKWREVTDVYQALSRRSATLAGTEN